MIDNSIDPPAGGDLSDSELTCNVESLSVDGINPSVGDHVEVKVGGTVKQVVNGVATIKAETVNDVPMPIEPVVDSDPDDSSGLGQLAQMADSSIRY